MSAFQEALQTGFEACLQTLKRVVEDLTPTEARWQPTDHTNHIAWLVWHMARVEDWWINRFLYGRTEVWTADGWASRFGMPPEGNGAGQTIEEVRAMPEIPLTDLIAYFDAVRAVSHQYLTQVTDAALAREYHHPSRGAMTGTGDLELPDPSATPEVRLLVTEVMISCVSGMLLCLDREQRLTYILGDIFGVTDTVGAELLEISRENFRQRLARARRDLHNFMNDKCGLVNRANPCRCVKKTRGFIQAGHVDPTNLLFVQDRVRQVREVVPKTYETISTLDDQCADLYRQHPFYEPPDLTPMLRRLIESAAFRRATELP